MTCSLLHAVAGSKVGNTSYFLTAQMMLVMASTSQQRRSSLWRHGKIL